MKFKIQELTRAQEDIRHIFYWIFERSPQGATSWMTAYEKMLTRLGENPEMFPLAQESDGCEFEIREIHFRTRSGRTYRAVFFIEGDTVYVARIRGPGQAPVDQSEFL